MNYGGGGYGGPPGGGYGGPPGGGGYGGPPGGGPPGGGYGPPPGGMGGPPPGWGPPPPPMPMGPTLGPNPPGGTNGLAVASLITGILALPGACCCYSSIPLGIAAIVMGFMAMNKLKLQADGGGNNKVMAYLGIGTGISGIVICVIVAAMGAGMQMMEQLQHR